MSKALPIVGICTAVFLAACSAWGTKTLYRVDQKVVKPLRIGYSQLAFEELVAFKEPDRALMYDSALVDIMRKENIIAVNFSVEDYRGFDSVDPENIRVTCAENELDGFIFTEHQYTTIYIFNLDEYTNAPHAESEVEMKYFDSKGNLLMHTSHNTYKGNSYMNHPTALRTVYDGTKGALKRILSQFE